MNTPFLPSTFLCFPFLRTLHICRNPQIHFLRFWFRCIPCCLSYLNFLQFRSCSLHCLCNFQCILISMLCRNQIQCSLCIFQLDFFRINLSFQFFLFFSVEPFLFHFPQIFFQFHDGFLNGIYLLFLLFHLIEDLL